MPRGMNLEPIRRNAQRQSVLLQPFRGLILGLTECEKQNPRARHLFGVAPWASDVLLPTSQVCFGPKPGA